MKSMYIMWFILISLINFQNILGDDNQLELYHNYTFYSAYAKTYSYYFNPHFEAGNTISFKIVYTTYYLCNSFYIYNGNTRIAILPNTCYGFYHEYELSAPDPPPSILRLDMSSTTSNAKIKFFVYIYNKGYKIPLKFPNCILNNIIFKDLEIPFEIVDLPENKKLILESKIEYPQLGDNVVVDVNQNSYKFSEAKSVEILLEKDYTYTIRIKPFLESLVTLNTYIMIYFAEDRDFNTLFYPDNILKYNTILLNKKWYIIDSVNNIDEYNKYNLTINEGFESNDKLRYNIKVKRYQTNDITYIKNNIPTTIYDYEEILEPIIEKSLTFTVCEKSCLDAKAILIEIDLNYNYERSTLYQYSINKIFDNKELEFKSYDINWYIYYEFNPLYVQSKDTVFISTNHSNTIFYYNSYNYRTFKPFYNGQLYVSYPDDNSNRNQIKLLYSDKSAKKGDNDDIGNLEIYKFNNLEMSFEEVNLNDYIETKIYSFELKNNQDKYLYAIALKNKDYYIFYDGSGDYLFFAIKSMPVQIMKFAKSKMISDITLMTNKNEYLIKAGNTASFYDLINIYIIKNENSKSLTLEEGKPKIFTFSKNEDNINIQINLDNDDISCINLKIASKNIKGKLYVTYLERTFILNNEGININNIDKNNKILINIKNEDKIDEDIPILIKSVIPSNKIISLSLYNKYQFEQDKIGIIKFKNDKNVKMKFRNPSSGAQISYYYSFLSEDLNYQVLDIINPQLFNKKTINVEEYDFEIKTNVELERSTNYGKKYLYLIFSFNKKVEISTGDIDVLYNKFSLSYSTIYSNNIWYIIDSVNSIDNYNSYNLIINKGYYYLDSSIIDIRIKRYETNDITYIKNNLPISNDDYDELQSLEPKQSMKFVTCEKINCLKSKAILIQLNLNYHADGSYSYTYELQKNLANQIIDFKSYDIKKYTTYKFSGVPVKNKDRIFISTKYPNTIYPVKNDQYNYYKLFETFYNGYLYVSLNDEGANDIMFNITYSDEKTKMENEDDNGHVEIFKFDSEDTSFEELNISDTFESKIYNFELMKNNGKYYYIRIIGNEKYYIFYDSENIYSFFKIENMPVDIIKFSKNDKNSEAVLVSNKNEYLMKIGISKFEYNLFNMYIIKKENSKKLDLEEGKIKMVTYLPNENDLILQINILKQQLSEEEYINLRIPSKNLNGNLYISHEDNLYVLNNFGVNIRCNTQNKIILNIKDIDNINQEIPIIIKLGLLPEQFKIINNDIDKYELDQEHYGIIRYTKDKLIKMKFKMEFEGITFSYYNCYLPDNFIDDTSDIIHPELFNKKKLDVKEHNFEMITKLPLERINNSKKENLYLIFSFDGKTKVSTIDINSFYNKSKLSFSTMISNDIWYIVDSVNSIDNYNKYKLIINEGYQNNNEQIFNIRMKKYETNDIEYIKKNLNNLNDNDYDEIKSLIYNDELTFSLCETDSCLNKKAILIEIKLSNDNENQIEYSIEKILENKPLEFRKYDINWYTNYNFSPIEVRNKDSIIISTNHKNSIFINNDNKYRTFESFCDGMLFISFPKDNSNKSVVKINYSNNNIIGDNLGDIGHIEVLKLNSGEANLYRINIDELILPKVFKFELKNNEEKYFYIKNNNKDSYYIFSESEDEDNSFLKIEQLPIDAIKFSETYSKNDISFMDSNKEYLVRIGYNKNIYSLINMYIIKNEDIDIIDLEEGQLKIITFPSRETEKYYQINLLTEEKTKELYINLKIPHKYIDKELYITYLDNEYILNNKGVNIYNIEIKNSFDLKITNKNRINENIPILIKYGIRTNNIQFLPHITSESSKDKYEFNAGNFGIIRYLNNKTVNMKFNPNITNTMMNYYSCYLPEDFIQNNTNILNPKYFNSTKIDSKNPFFEVKTSLEIEKDKTYFESNLNNDKLHEYLYLIFSFDKKTEVIMKENSIIPDEPDEPDDKSDEGSSTPSTDSAPSEPKSSGFFDTKMIIIIICVCTTIIIIILIIAFTCRRKKAPKNIDNLLNGFGGKGEIKSIGVTEGK